VIPGFKKRVYQTLNITQSEIDRQLPFVRKTRGFFVGIPKKWAKTLAV